MRRSLPWRKNIHICVILKEDVLSLDLQTATVILWLQGLDLIRLDLRGVRSWDEIIVRGRAFIEEHPPAPGEWVIGYGFDHNIFDDPILPDIHVAESISTQYPVFLDRICGHVGTVNRKVLEIAGYDDDTVVTGGVLG